MPDNFSKLTITLEEEAQKEALFGWLSFAEIDSIVEHHSHLDAYASEDKIDSIMDVLLYQAKISKERITIEKVKPTNWNTKWEASFQPVEIGQVYIRAPFHETPLSTFTDLVIAPKMAFGTGCLLYTSPSPRDS